MAKINVSTQAAMTADVYHASWTREQLLDLRATLAKTMNQRAVRLERGKSLVTGESLAKMDAGAYAEMNAYLKPAGKKPRFSEARNSNKDIFQLKREITVLQGLIGMKSSTVGGWHKIENKRIRTFEKMGLSSDLVKSKDFYNFLNSKTFETLSKLFDSDQVVELLEKEELEPEQLKKLEESFDTWLSDEGEKTWKEAIGVFNATIIK